MNVRQRLPKNWLPYALLAPSIFILLTLILYPMGFALINSFSQWNLQTSPTPTGFIGFQNYRLVFQTTPFISSLLNTVALSVVGTFIEFMLGLGIALLLSTQLMGMTVFRALLIMPTTVAPIVVGFLFRYLYTPYTGLFSWLLDRLGFPVPPQGLLGNSATALASIAVADIWEWTPFFAIVLYAGLLSVPQDVLEAAKVDGANAVRRFWHVMLPLIRPVAAIIVMIRFMQLFNMFDLVYVLTAGGPGTSSRTLSFNLYQEGLVNYNIGLTAAMTWLIVLAVTLIVNLYIWLVFRNWEW